MDQKVNGHKVPHPATVVCDYICNSMFSGQAHPALVEVMEEYGLLCFDVFDGPLGSTDYSDDLLAQRHDWGRLMKELISCGFPPERSAFFFDRLREDRHYDQLLCVNSVVDYLYSFVSNR